MTPRFRPGRRLAALAGVAALLAAPGAASSQEPGAEPGSELRVYLLTMGPGDAIWEKFGHNAIWISDAARGTDLAYNYGMFDFAEPGFLQRFLAGSMRYWMEPFDGPASTRHYAAQNRSVWLQELNLRPALRLALRDFLEWNARPENRYYEYDYYRDNCSTRVRDALDRVLDGALRARLSERFDGSTYRSHSLRLTADGFAAYTGILLGLGPFTDRPISAWDESFIPMELREHARNVSVVGPDGAEAPLVLSETTLFESSREPPPETPPDRTLLYLGIGLALGALLATLGRAGSRRRATRTPFLALAAGWSLLAGTLGLVLAFLWAFTGHVSTYGNENVLQLSPLSVALGILLFTRARRAPPAAYLAAAVLALSVLGFLLQLLPGFDQVNGGIIALALLAHAGVLLGLWQLVATPAVVSAREPAPETAERLS